MNRISIHLIITGRVQGVGYRDSMRMVAQALDITGWVRNLEDGSVEALVQGDPGAVEQIIGWCHNGPPGANVRYVDAKPIDSAQEYIAFSRIPNA